MSQFVENVIAILRSDDKTSLRLVDWNGRVYISKQASYVTDSGETRYGKVKALVKEDLQAIVENSEVINLAFDGETN